MTLGSALCTDCGLCCDGTLFSSVSLDPAGLAAARERRLAVVETRSGSRLALPCAALRGVLCGIYEDRPECCADYGCELVHRVADRGLPVAEARKIIEATRTTRARVTAALGDTPWWVARRSAREAARANAKWAEDHAELVADLDTLELLVRQHFWG